MITDITLSPVAYPGFLFWLPGPPPPSITYDNMKFNLHSYAPEPPPATNLPDSIAGLKKTAEILVALVEEVQASGNNDTKLKELKAEIDALLVIIDNLWGREPSSQDREFKKEASMFVWAWLWSGASISVRSIEGAKLQIQQGTWNRKCMKSEKYIVTKVGLSLAMGQ